MGAADWGRNLESQAEHSAERSSGGVSSVEVLAS
jgi:hypothetical protein